MTFNNPLKKSILGNNKDFFTEEFLLNTKTSEYLFSIVKDLPIIDYHCHLPVNEIALNKNFETITQIWLYGDHYKWRAMRTNGVNEKYITGEASDWEKFLAWAETVPYTIRNPLYHWTHMELKNPFGISGKLLNKETAKEIWEQCNILLGTDNFSTRGLLNHFNVQVVCTTDDPLDNLEHHKKIYDDNELTPKATIKNFLIVQKEGERQVSRKVDHYNLQMIIAVGFKVNNERAVQFRKWANTIVKDFTIQGWVMDDERLKNGGSVLTKEYFEKQLEKIREIRLSERKFYQKITDI
jgi:hypothetical protein